MNTALRRWGNDRSSIFWLLRPDVVDRKWCIVVGTGLINTNTTLVILNGSFK